MYQVGSSSESRLKIQVLELRKARGMNCFLLAFFAFSLLK
ncbi:MAG: hypothetical protein ACD_75C00507G0005 [uncultured bacterium]|nr:MAG: hypothetical protein ACD_75C00507G0005 [uncultured bacterium]